MLHDMRRDIDRQNIVIAELKAQLANPTNDDMASRLEKCEMEKEILRKRSEAYRKQVSRLNQKDGSGPSAPIEHYRRPVPGCEGKTVFGTEMIGNENAALRMAKVRANGLNSDQPENATAGPLELDQHGHRRCRSGTQHGYSNFGTETVTLVMPGPNRKRAGIGGTEKSEAALLSQVISFLETNISLNSHTKVMPNQLGTAAISVSAVFEPRRGRGRRLACPTGTEGTPVNAIGMICPKTLTNGVHATFLALDKTAVKEKLVSTSDTLTINYDISGFNEYAQLGTVLHMMYIIDDGADACGQLRHRVVIKTICLNSLPASDKKSVDILKEDGSLFDKEVPLRLVMELAMSGHLWDVMEHPCMFWGMDKGSECMGAGRGKNMARLRSALLGRGSPLEQIFGTRESLHAALDGEHGPFLSEVMKFIGAVDKRDKFPVRQLPERPDTSKPVRSIPFKVKILSRKSTITKTNVNIDGEVVVVEVKTKVIISDEVVEVESRISTARSTLWSYPLIDQVPHGNYCDKHLIDRGAVDWTKVVKQPLGNILKCISEIRKMNIHLILKLEFRKVVQEEGKNGSSLHAKVAELLGQERLKPLLERFPNGLQRQTEAVAAHGADHSDPNGLQAAYTGVPLDHRFRRGN
jgi:hypothetical protein